MTLGIDRQPLVLVAFGADDVRELHAARLVFEGFRVAEASDGAQAVSMATALMPDAVVMDLSLPRMNGCEAARRIRRNASTRHIPVIALTEHPLDRLSMRPRDFDELLRKPCLFEALLCKLRALLAIVERHRGA